MKQKMNRAVLKLPTDMVEGIEQIFSTISNLKIPERLIILEERLKQLEDIEEIAMRVDNLESALWTSKEVLTSNEAAVYLGMENSYLYKLTCQKKIPFYKPNDGRIYFKKAELDDWATRKPMAHINSMSNSNTSKL